LALQGHKISAIIPALNEQQSVGKVIAELPPFVDRVIVCDNGSTDKTSEVARKAGADVVQEARKGYGAACLKAIEHTYGDADLLLFVDADYSDYPAEAERIVKPIVDGDCDLVIGSRMMTLKQHHALPPVAAFGNWLSANLIRIIWGSQFTDIGPFRAIRFDAYQRLAMQDRNFGWTIEMQIKAAKKGLRCTEVPVSYRKRIGVSKVSGTVSGSILAGIKFLWIIFRETLSP
jgi:glycosyltransferase involved in cell wall biosynthesis